jgi:dethiobiotin synthetase
MTFVVVAGTATEIGKTWVTAELAAALVHRGIAVAARKPVQSFDPEADWPTDADLLGAATGEEPHTVCPRHRWLPRAMAPPMAADALGAPAFTVSDLVAEVRESTLDASITLVESVGGVRSPIASDGDTVTLAEALHPALIVLVADAELGTINAVRLSVDALVPYSVVVYLNRFDRDEELHARNHDWLVTRVGLEVVTDPEALERFVVALASATG